MDVLAEQAVGSDHDVDLAAGHALENPLRLLGGAEAREGLDPDRVGLEALLEGPQVRLEPLAAHHIEPLRAACAQDREIWENASNGAGEPLKKDRFIRLYVATILRHEDAGCAAVMPLASPIGSGLGVVNPYYIREIRRRLRVPVIVDAGVGTASDACITMEQGVDGVLMNTAIAAADDPVAMGHAMRLAIQAGRLAYLAGRMPSREIAVPSSPTGGMLD